MSMQKNPLYFIHSSTRIVDWVILLSVGRYSLRKQNYGTFLFLLHHFAINTTLRYLAMEFPFCKFVCLTSWGIPLRLIFTGQVQ